jgi:hypothetical protein
MNYCTTACRTLVFLSIIFLVGYIIVKNEKKIESFVENLAGEPNKLETAKQHDTITLAVRNYLDRDATDEDFKLYGKVMQNPTDILSVVEAIKASAEYKDRQTKTTHSSKLEQGDQVLDVEEIGYAPLLLDLKQSPFDKRIETYRLIIDKFQHVLDRMPTNKELVYYTYKLLNDSTFTMDKLQNILQGSKEYSILEKNQSNLVNGELPGNITDAQLTMDITNKYNQVFGDQPSTEMLGFLKMKYISYKLDEHKLDRLLRFLRDLDTSNSSSVMEEWQQDYNQNSTANNTCKAQAPKVINIITTNADDVDDILQSLKSGKDNVMIKTNASGLNTSTNTSSNKSLDQSISSANGLGGDQASNTRSSNYTDPFYKKLAQTRLNNSCQTVRADDLSVLQSNRNADTVSFVCGRNTYLKGIDPDVITAGYTNLTKKRDYKKSSKFNAEPITYSYEPENGIPLSSFKDTLINPDITFGI